MTRAALALALVAPLLAACRTECHGDGEATPQELAKDRRAAGRAQTICKELQRPQIVLTGDRLLLRATREVEVAARADVPGGGARVEPLFARLERHRRHYRAVWPADPFEPYAAVELDPALDAGRALSVAATVAAAGYPTMRLTAGDASAELAWPRCGERLRAAAGGAASAAELVARARDACASVDR